MSPAGVGTAVTSDIIGAVMSGQSEVVKVSSTLDPVPVPLIAYALKWYVVPQVRPVMLVVKAPVVKDPFQ